MIKSIHTRWCHCIFCLLVSTSIARAETVELTSGRKVTGTIVERSTDYIAMDTGIGVNITFYLDEIVYIDGQKPGALPQQEATQVAIARDLQESISNKTDGYKSTLSRSPSGTAFFWEVRRAGGKPSYILGSIHVADESFYPLPVPIEKAFQHADVLVVESNIQDGHEDFLKTMYETALYKEGRTLKDDLSPETFEQLKTYLKKYKLDVTPFMVMRPWVVAMSLQDIAMANMGLNSLYGIDNHFLRVAEDRLKIVELESVAEQMKLLSTVIDQNDLLEFVLFEIESTEEHMKEFIDGWKKGDMARLEELVMTDFMAAESEELVEEFLYKRNDKMTEKIDELLQGEGVHFIVVGAAHLMRDRGIIQQLAQKGYSIKPL